MAFATMRRGTASSIPGTPQAQLQNAIARKMATWLSDPARLSRCGVSSMPSKVVIASATHPTRGEDRGSDQRTEVGTDVHHAGEQAPGRGLLAAKPPERGAGGKRHGSR